MKEEQKKEPSGEKTNIWDVPLSSSSAYKAKPTNSGPGLDVVLTVIVTDFPAIDGLSDVK